jgi:cell wall assembly regulator SMI1
MPEYPPISDTLITLQSWMHENAPGVSFSPPANPAALENFTEKSGLDLPHELRQLLLLSNGEARKSAGAIGNWRLMPISEIQAAWGLLSRLFEKGAFDELQPDPSPYLRKAWWHPAWIPVASSDTGNYYCIDTDPPEPARYGQVLLFLQEQPERPLAAASLSAWLDRITRDLLSGLYTYDEPEGFNGEAFLWSSLEGKHLFDDVEGKLIAQ